MAVPVAFPSSSSASSSSPPPDAFDAPTIKAAATAHVAALLARKPAPTPAQLLASAKTQAQTARAAAQRGEPDKQLAALTKAAALLSGALEGSHALEGAERRKVQDGIKAFMDGPDYAEIERRGDVERRLGALAAAAQSSNSRKEEAVSSAGGGSIADRKRALAGAGLAVDAAGARRALPAVPTTLPSVPTSPPSTSAPAFAPSASPQSPTHTSPLSPTMPAAHRPPSVVVPPSFGAAMANSGVPAVERAADTPAPAFERRTHGGALPPPLSPSTSTHAFPSTHFPTSPTHTHASMGSVSSALSSMTIHSPPPPPAPAPIPEPVVTPSAFAHAFPSLSEFEHRDFSPPGPTAVGAGAGAPISGLPPPSLERKDTLLERGLARFPALPPDAGFSPIPVARPASTPVTPLQDHFASRPASPTKRALPPPHPNRSPDPSADGLPKGALTAPELRALLSSLRGATVLLLDARPRPAFVAAHIAHDALVCVDPALLAPGADESAEDVCAAIEAGLPAREQTLWANRAKFELVITLDRDGVVGPAPPPALARLAEVVWERASFRKSTKRAPVVLRGGIEGWAAADGELVGEGAAALVEEVRAREREREGWEGAGRARAGTAGGRPLTLAENQARMRMSVEGTKASTSGSPLPNGHGHVPSPSAYPTPPSAYTSSPQLPSQSPPHMNGDYSPQHTGDTAGSGAPRLARKPTFARLRDAGAGHARGAESLGSIASPPMSPTFGATPIAYPALHRAPSSFSGGSGAVSPPPVASINASPLSGARRRSEAVDPAPVRAPAPIDYPHLDLRAPPPIAAATRPGHSFSPSMPTLPAPPAPPLLPVAHTVGYWDASEVGLSGLKNMGNTCYMNATLQCLSATAPFAAFFRDGTWRHAVNVVNPLGTKGVVAHAFARLVRDLWGSGGTNMTFLTPTDFRRSITATASQFAGSEQHDSQEFLSFLMDGLHEDLNRVLHRPTVDRTPEEEAALERLPPQVAAHREWAVYRMRNDSVVVDWFQGQFRSRLTCFTCGTTSTTYNAFMYLSLPIPSKLMGGKVTLYQCLDAFVAEEVLEKSDAWFCPHCKQKRKARKQLSLSRLPPVLLIHLKRFSAKTHFTDKVDKLVDFPLRSLDLEGYVPPPLPPGGFSAGAPGGVPAEDRGDPRAQLPPFRYDLYAVTNHFGSLSGGHYTAFVKSGREWRYCDDSRVSPAAEKDVVGKPAYVLYYKRVRA